MSCEPIEGCVLEDSSFELMQRIEIAGVNALQADINAINWKAFDVEDPTTEVDSGPLVVADVIFDTLQTRPGIDDGFNFVHNVPDTVFTDPGVYRIEHRITPTAGSPFYLRPFQITVDSIWSS